MRARALLILVVALTPACGNKPPAGPSGTSTTVVRAGEYTVTISATSGFSPGTTVMCFLFNGGTGDTISFPATVAADNGTFTLRATGPADLGLNIAFRSAGVGTIAGPVSGQVRDPTSGVVVSFAPLPANFVPGMPAADSSFIGFNTLTPDPNVFSGSVTGQVTLANASASTMCANSTWQMRLK